LLRADDIVHDDNAPVKAQIVRKAFRGSEFLYTLRLRSGETVLAHVPSHHDHRVGEWIGIRAEVDHVVTFDRSGGQCERITPDLVTSPPPSLTASRHTPLQP
jgi:iron(III) transport system ATP-binding protein